MIRLARPELGPEEARAAQEVLASGMLVQGAVVAEFEARLADRCGRRHAVACSSGTSALELALEALGVKGSAVLCPDLTWPSPAHAIRRVGATPRLLDVDAATWNVQAETLATARRNPAGAEPISAAVVIDQFGSPADHRAIAAAIPDLPIVVDAACAIGATLGGRPSASYGTVACMSFHPRKVITTGEGGACLTDDEGLAQELRMLRNHGQTGIPGEFAAPAGNHRMTEMAAAIGLVQLDRLDAILSRRRALGERYRAALDPRLLQAPAPEAEPNYQTFGLRLTPGTRDDVLSTLGAAGVEAGRLSYALHRLDSLAGLGSDATLPNATALDACGIAVPLHTQISDADQTRILDVLRPLLAG